MHKTALAAWMGLAVSITGASIAAVGCGDSKGPSDDQIGTDAAAPGEFDNLEALDVSPKEADLLAGDTNGSQAFTVQGRFKDGSTRDLTSVAAWRVSVADLVDVQGGMVTARGTRGGVAKLSAIVGGAAGEAELRVRWVKTILAPGAPAGSEGRFKGTTDDPALAPQLAYPLANALFPPNLPPIEVQWRPAASTDMFEIGFTGPTMDLHVVTPCNAIKATGGCGLVLDRNLWTGITATLGGQDPADVVVRGAGPAAGKMGVSAKAPTQFAQSEVRGGLYYFNTRATATEKAGVFRYDFATNKVGAFYTDGQCAGCHALSKDGTKMLAGICTNERGCERPIQLAVVDVATKKVVTPAMPVGDTDALAWAPNNKFYVTSPSCGTIAPEAPNRCATGSGGGFQLIDATTNTPIGAVPTGPSAMYPSFSNDGKRLVYARGASFIGPLNIDKSSLYFIDFDGAAAKPTWGAEKPLLLAGPNNSENNYHPSFSPDDAWVLFTRSHCEPGDPAALCDSYNDFSARTWVVTSAGGNAVECARANGSGRNIVSWPKWSPFKSTYKGGDIYWYTVSSTHDYGFYTAHNRDGAGNPTDGVQQLWLVAFDPNKARSAQDPSFAPVWLPFQDVESSNHIGQWTEAIVGGIQ